MAQFVEYVSTELPGTKLVSYREDRSQIFLRDNAYGITFYVAIEGITPSLIEIAPKYKLNLTLLSSVSTEAIVRHSLNPAATSTIPSVELIFNGQVTKEDGSKVAFNKPLDQLDILPAKFVEGHLYFEVVKTKNYGPSVHRLYLA